MDRLRSVRSISGMELSPVALGTMRFADKGATVSEVERLIAFLYHEVGVNLHHSSYEYASYALYREAVRRFRKQSGVNVRHICKLSAPDFREPSFSATALRNRVQQEISQLGAERIDVLQWLYRTEPIEDNKRLPGLREQQEVINQCFDSLVQEGLVGVIGTFPYTTVFGKAVSDSLPRNTGWITYHNLLERNNLDQLPPGQWLIGLRPLAAGKLVTWTEQLSDPEFDRLFPGSSDRKEAVLHTALDFCLEDARVLSNVLSINNLAQAQLLKQVMESRDKLIPDRQAILSSLQSWTGQPA